MALFTAYAHLLFYPFGPFTAYNLQGATWSSFGNGFQDLLILFIGKLLNQVLYLNTVKEIFSYETRRYFWNVIFFNKIKSKLEKQFKQDSG